MIQLTRRDLEHAYDQVVSTSRAVRGYRERGQTIARNAISAAEVLAGAAASGLFAGRFGAPHLMLGGHAVPLDAAAALGLHTLAFFDMFGPYGEHIHNISNGILAQYVARWGVGYGTHLREQAGLPRIAGYQSPAMTEKRSPLTAAELAGIAAQAR
jgi:hypothetical protein